MKPDLTRLGKHDLDALISDGYSDLSGTLTELNRCADPILRHALQDDARHLRKRIEAAERVQRERFGALA